MSEDKFSEPAEGLDRSAQCPESLGASLQSSPPPPMHPQEHASPLPSTQQRPRREGPQETSEATQVQSVRNDGRLAHSHLNAYMEEAPPDGDQDQDRSGPFWSTSNHSASENDYPLQSEHHGMTSLQSLRSPQHAAINASSSLTSLNEGGAVASSSTAAGNSLSTSANTERGGDVVMEGLARLGPHHHHHHHAHPHFHAIPFAGHFHPGRRSSQSTASSQQRRPSNADLFVVAASITSSSSTGGGGGGGTTTGSGGSSHLGAAVTCPRVRRHTRTCNTDHQHPEDLFAHDASLSLMESGGAFAASNDSPPRVLSSQEEDENMFELADGEEEHEAETDAHALLKQHSKHVACPTLAMAMTMMSNAPPPDAERRHNNIDDADDARQRHAASPPTAAVSMATVAGQQQQQQRDPYHQRGGATQQGLLFASFETVASPPCVTGVPTAMASPILAAVGGGGGNGRQTAVAPQSPTRAVMGDAEWSSPTSMGREASGFPGLRSRQSSGSTQGTSDTQHHHSQPHPSPATQKEQPPAQSAPHSSAHVGIGSKDGAKRPGSARCKTGAHETRNPSSLTNPDLMWEYHGHGSSGSALPTPPRSRAASSNASRRNSASVSISSTPRFGTLDRPQATHPSPIQLLQSGSPRGQLLHDIAAVTLHSNPSLVTMGTTDSTTNDTTHQTFTMSGTGDRSNKEFVSTSPSSPDAKAVNTNSNPQQPLRFYAPPPISDSAAAPRNVGGPQVSRVVVDAAGLAALHAMTKEELIVEIIRLRGAAAKATSASVSRTNSNQRDHHHRNHNYNNFNAYASAFETVAATASSSSNKTARPMGSLSPGGLALTATAHPSAHHHHHNHHPPRCSTAAPPSIASSGGGGGHIHVLPCASAESDGMVSRSSAVGMPAMPQSGRKSSNGDLPPASVASVITGGGSSGVSPRPARRRQQSYGDYDDLRSLKGFADMYGAGGAQSIGGSFAGGGGGGGTPVVEPSSTTAHARHGRLRLFASGSHLASELSSAAGTVNAATFGGGLAVDLHSTVSSVASAAFGPGSSSHTGPGMAANSVYSTNNANGNASFDGAMRFAAFSPQARFRALGGVASLSNAVGSPNYNTSPSFGGSVGGGGGGGGSGASPIQTITSTSHGSSLRGTDTSSMNAGAVVNATATTTTSSGTGTGTHTSSRHSAASLKHSTATVPSITDRVSFVHHTAHNNQANLPHHHNHQHHGSAPAAVSASPPPIGLHDDHLELPQSPHALLQQQNIYFSGTFTAGGSASIKVPLSSASSSGAAGGGVVSPPPSLIPMGGTSTTTGLGPPPQHPSNNNGASSAGNLIKDFSCGSSSPGSVAMPPGASSVGNAGVAIVPLEGCVSSGEEAGQPTQSSASPPPPLRTPPGVVVSEDGGGGTGASGTSSIMPTETSPNEGVHASRTSSSAGRRPSLQQSPSPARRRSPQEVGLLLGSTLLNDTSSSVFSTVTMSGGAAVGRGGMHGRHYQNIANATNSNAVNHHAHLHIAPMSLQDLVTERSGTADGCFHAAFPKGGGQGAVPTSTTTTTSATVTTPSTAHSTGGMLSVVGGGARTYSSIMTNASPSAIFSSVASGAFTAGSNNGPPAGNTGVDFGDCHHFPSGVVSVPMSTTAGAAGARRLSAMMGSDVLQSIARSGSMYIPTKYSQQAVLKNDDALFFETLNDYILLEEVGCGQYGRVVQAARDGDDSLFVVKIIPRRKIRNRFRPQQQRRPSAGESFGAPPSRAVAIHDSNDTDQASNTFVGTEGSPDGFGGSGVLEQEIAVMKKLRHRNIVRLEEVIDDPNDEHIYLVMPYIERGPVLKIENGRCAALEIDVVRAYMKQLLSAVAYLHRNQVVHCDIKPDNVLLGADGRIYLTDFGVCEIFSSGRESDGSDAKHTIPDAPKKGSPSLRRLSLSQGLDAAGGFSAATSRRDSGQSTSLQPPLPASHGRRLSGASSGGGPLSFSTGLGQVPPSSAAPQHDKFAAPMSTTASAAFNLRSTKCTPAFAAPETMTGSVFNGAKADVWSVGVTMFVMLFGRLPFAGETVYGVFRAISLGEVSYHVSVSAEAAAYVEDMCSLHAEDSEDDDDENISGAVEAEADAGCALLAAVHALGLPIRLDWAADDQRQDVFCDDSKTGGQQSTTTLHVPPHTLQAMGYDDRHGLVTKYRHALGLLQRLLARDPAERSSARRACEHAFFGQSTFQRLRGLRRASSTKYIDHRTGSPAFPTGGGPIGAEGDEDALGGSGGGTHYGEGGVFSPLRPTVNADGNRISSPARARPSAAATAAVAAAQPSAAARVPPLDSSVSPGSNSDSQMMPHARQITAVHATSNLMGSGGAGAGATPHPSLFVSQSSSTCYPLITAEHDGQDAPHEVPVLAVAEVSNADDRGGRSSSGGGNITTSSAAGAPVDNNKVASPRRLSALDTLRQLSAQRQPLRFCSHRSSPSDTATSSNSSPDHSPSHERGAAPNTLLQGGGPASAHLVAGSSTTPTHDAQGSTVVGWTPPSTITNTHQQQQQQPGTTHDSSVAALGGTCDPRASANTGTAASSASMTIDLSLNPALSQTMAYHSASQRIGAGPSDTPLGPPAPSSLFLVTGSGSGSGSGTAVGIGGSITGSGSGSGSGGTGAEVTAYLMSSDSLCSPHSSTATAAAAGGGASAVHSPGPLPNKSSPVAQTRMVQPDLMGASTAGTTSTTGFLATSSSVDSTTPLGLRRESSSDKSSAILGRSAMQPSQSLEGFLTTDPTPPELVAAGGNNSTNSIWRNSEESHRQSATTLVDRNTADSSSTNNNSSGSLAGRARPPHLTGVNNTTTTTGTGSGGIGGGAGGGGASSTLHPSSNSTIGTTPNTTTTAATSTTTAISTVAYAYPNPSSALASTTTSDITSSAFSPSGLSPIVINSARRPTTRQSPMVAAPATTTTKSGFVAVPACTDVVVASPTFRQGGIGSDSGKRLRGSGDDSPAGNGVGGDGGSPLAERRAATASPGVLRPLNPASTATSSRLHPPASLPFTDTVYATSETAVQKQNTRAQTAGMTRGVDDDDDEDMNDRGILSFSPRFIKQQSSQPPPQPPPQPQGNQREHRNYPLSGSPNTQNTDPAKKYHSP